MLCPGSASQYDQYAVAGGVAAQASSAGVGYSVPLSNWALPMRQMKPGPSCCVPVVVKPPLCSRFMPVVGLASQPRTIGPAQCPKSTATIAPCVGEQASMASAAASDGSSSPAAVPTATMTAAEAARMRVRREPMGGIGGSPGELAAQSAKPQIGP